MQYFITLVMLMFGIPMTKCINFIYYKIALYIKFLNCSYYKIEIHIESLKSLNIQSNKLKIHINQFHLI